MLENSNKYFEVLNDIKRILITASNKIVENNKWRSSFFDTLAKDLKINFSIIKVCQREI